MPPPQSWGIPIVFCLPPEHPQNKVSSETEPRWVPMFDHLFVSRSVLETPGEHRTQISKEIALGPARTVLEAGSRSDSMVNEFSIFGYCSSQIPLVPKTRHRFCAMVEEGVPLQHRLAGPRLRRVLPR